MSTPKRKSTKPAIPALARTLPELCALKHSVDCGDFWTITDGYAITFAAQKVGARAGWASIPRDVFLRFARWYFTGDTDMRRGVTAAQIEAIAAAFKKAEGPK